METRRLLKTAGILAAAGVGLWAFVTFLLPLVSPFLAAFLLAVVAEPAVLFLTRKARLPRWAAGALCVLGAYLLLFGILFLLGRLLFRELGLLAPRLPELLENVGPMLDRLQTSLLRLTTRLPDGLGAGLSQWVERFFRNGAGLLEALPQKLLGWLTALAAKLPGLALFAVTTVAASFMAAVQLPRLRIWLSRVLPSPWRKKVTRGWTRVKGTAKGWLLAQGKLLAITFSLLTVGFFLLRTKRVLLWALATTAVDALPVFGSGAVLIPWAMGCFLGGSVGRGIALLLLYGTVAITRITMEPRLVGRQTGLPPIWTLAAIYVGGKLCGLGGMILFPVAASVAAQFAHLTKV